MLRTMDYAHSSGVNFYPSMEMQSHLLYSVGGITFLDQNFSGTAIEVGSV